MLSTDHGLSLAGWDEPSRTNRDAGLLLRVSAMLHSFRAMHDARTPLMQSCFARYVLMLFMEILPAESGGVLASSSDPSVPFVRLAQTGSPLVVDPHLIEQLWSERTAILSTDGLTSTLAAPIIVRDQVEAALYFTTSEGNDLLDKHLQLLVALAGMASVVWETRRCSNGCTRRTNFCGNRYAPNTA